MAPGTKKRRYRNLIRHLLRQWWAITLPDERRAVGISCSVGLSILVLVLASHLLAPDVLSGLPRFVATVLFCGAMLVLAANTASRALQQHRPEYASLVPGLHRRLVRLLQGQTGACAVLAAVVYSLLYGHVGYALAVAGIVAVYVMLVMRYGILALAPLAISALDWLLPQPAGIGVILDAAAALSEPVLAPVAVAIDLALLRFAVRRLLPQGRDRQWRNAAAPRARPRAAMNGAGPSSHLPGLLKVARHARAGIVQAMVLAMLAMAASLGARYAPVSAQLPAIASVLLVFLLLTPMLFVLSVRTSIAASTGEQGLYRLAPGAPAAGALNRQLCHTLLRPFLLVWLATTVCSVTAAMVAMAATAAGGTAVAAATLFLSSLTLPGASLLLRDYATEPVGSMAVTTRCLSLKTAAGGVAAMVTCLVVLAMARQVPVPPWLALTLVTTAIASAVIVRRRARMLAGPPAFPAGRLA